MNARPMQAEDVYRACLHQGAQIRRMPFGINIRFPCASRVVSWHWIADHQAELVRIHDDLTEFTRAARAARVLR